MKKYLALLLALSLIVMGAFAGVATAQEEERVFTGLLEDAAMHSLYLHMDDGSHMNISMNLGDEAVEILPEEAGLTLGNRLAVRAVSRDGAYEATRINVLTCLAGPVAEYGKNGFSIDDCGVEHVFIVDDTTTTFPQNGFLPGDVVEAAYDETSEDEPLYQVYLAGALEGVVQSWEDDELTLVSEEQGQVVFNTTGAYDLDALAENPQDKAVTVTFFGFIDPECPVQPVHVYTVMESAE